MKGIIFLKLEEFVEETFGEFAWDEVLMNVSLSSDGAYTSGALYEDDEFFAIVGEICQQHNVDIVDAQKLFGRWVFEKLLAISPHDMSGYTDTFGFLRAVQEVIHVEVQKIHIDAILPTFEFLEQTDDYMKMRYVSPRKLYFFCQGLIESLSEHLGENLSVTVSEHSDDDGGQCVFELRKQ